MGKIMDAEWRKAQRYFAGGVNSPVRAFRAVGGHPVMMSSAKGAYLRDCEGKSYVDLCLSWGALLFGHADPMTVKAVSKQASHGTSFGCATLMENALAERIQDAFPGMQRMRFTSSGTEAVMSAIRLSRGYTGRKKILKFEGCYHGHADSLLVKAGSGLATFGSPDSAGIPGEIAGLTAVLPYNDEKALANFFKKNRDVACAIVEPVAANMGVVPGTKNFLALLRHETARTGALLIFDEVISGFRLGYGGAQHQFGIRPDLTVLGKIIGGGLPVGAFGGQRRIMDHLSPSGSVYQAGTLSGNPISMAAGLSVLDRVSPTLYEKLDRATTHLTDKLSAIFLKKNIRASIVRQGSMFTVFYSAAPPKNFREVMRTDTRMFRRIFRRLLAQGVYTPPSAFEASFLSAAHGPQDIGKALFAFERL